MTQLCATLHVLAGAALVGFWYLYALVLPFRRLREGIWHLARDRNWTWINLLGSAGAVLAILALVVLWHLHPDLDGRLGVAGVLAAVAGLSMLSGNLAWEAILWPILTRHDERVLAFDGPIYRSKVMLGYFAAAGLAFSVGYVLVGLALRDGPLGGLPAWCLIVGAPAFALGPMMGNLQVLVRSVGITLLAAGEIWIGVRLLTG